MNVPPPTNRPIRLLVVDDSAVGFAPKEDVGLLKCFKRGRELRGIGVAEGTAEICGGDRRRATRTVTLHKAHYGGAEIGRDDAGSCRRARQCAFRRRALQYAQRRNVYGLFLA